VAGTRSRDLLGPGGPFAHAFPAYEAREGQLAMADAVERALADEHALVCEAGTGTGKTLAYLVPAVLSGRKVVVSTATKALQEQILDKDLPLVERHLGVRAEALLVKGLGNYLCLRRFEELRFGPQAITDPSIGRSLPMLEAWARETETGDVAELSAMAEHDPVWREVASSSDTRVGAACEHFDRCFVTRNKREAERARLLVVNHHLFFADLAVKGAMGRAASRGGALPHYDAVIFDEAHQIEDIATDFFGTRVSRARLDAMLRDADRAFVAGGLADRLLTRLDGTALAASVRDAAEHLFAHLARAALGRAPRRGGDDAGEGRLPLAPDVWSGELLDAYHALDTALEALEGYADANAATEAVKLVAGRARDLRDDAARIVDPAANQVTWIDVKPRSIAVGASPIDVGATLRERVFDRVGAVVLTSATLATAARVAPSAERAAREATASSPFRFFRSRMGLDGALDIPVDELTVPSPFDYRARARLYVPHDLPEPGDAAFPAAAAERAADLIALTGGGAFVLCTSVRMMRALADALRGRTKEPPLLQGDAPKGALLARFRARRDAVLVATMSFWAGVDVPGDALRLVVIDKIPFAVPSDPIVVARAAVIERAGGNPFVEYSVPQAAITLKQGFGRLLRTQSDRGIVAVLDRRLVTRSYGKALLASLPPAPCTHDLDELARFWAALSASD
jgi:ATP-dependent DNA helicase DinG